jgi:hypothetical protein
MQRVRRYRRTTQTPAGKQAGRKAGREEAKVIQKLPFSGSNLEKKY